MTNLNQLIIHLLYSRLTTYALLVFHAYHFMIGTSYANEEEPSLLTRAKTAVINTWDSNGYELYIPINTWHNRAYYTKQEIENFNERPWGLGLGKYRYDADGDWHGLYFMAFSDSHQKIEPIAGYGFQKIWQADNQVKIGLGLSVGLTMREELNYTPIPLIVPLISVKYKKVAMQSTYVPGGDGHGNILFTWLRWEI